MSAKSRKQRRGQQGDASSADARHRIGETYSGTFQFGGQRGGYVVLEHDALGDVFVPNNLSGTALHGDHVRVTVTRDGRGDRPPTGEIERVLRHVNRRIVGKISRSRDISIVHPKNTKLKRLVEIHRQFSPKEVPDGAWVVVEIQRWSDSPDQPLVGKLIEVLGTEDDRRLPILLLVRSEGVVPEFPEEVEAEACERDRLGVSKEEIARRRDLRGRRIFTIDPATAKDFDDAVSLEAAGEFGWRIGVHIADVAHYVTPGSKLDAEAYDRATSIYPVDRVIPMLPEALSNRLCSLRPGEDTLTMSVFFTVSPDGELSDFELCNSVIHSMRRFTYEEVSGIFGRVDGREDSPHPAPEIPQALLVDLLGIRDAATTLFNRRMERHALDLDLPETEVAFDDKGIVEEIRWKQRLESHRLIEDLMIAANEAVGRELRRRRIPTLYRVHEEPDESRLRQLAPMLTRFGIQLPKGGSIHQAELQNAILKAQQHQAAAVVQRLVLRSLMRARYAPENVGHYGLASECYVHFTSPIRRYPDMIVHRGVKAMLAGESAALEFAQEVEGRLVEWGRHTSDREQRAQHIEWDAEQILCCEYMRRRHLGDIFDGFIGGVIGRGLFVELRDLPAEGFVAIRDVSGDYYELDEDALAFRGRRTGRILAVGDQVRVQVMAVNVLEGKLDFHLVSKVGEKRGSREGRRSGKQKGKGGRKGKFDRRKGRGRG